MLQDFQLCIEAHDLLVHRWEGDGGGGGRGKDLQLKSSPGNLFWKGILVLMVSAKGAGHWEVWEGAGGSAQAAHSRGRAITGISQI